MRVASICSVIITGTHKFIGVHVAWHSYVFSSVVWGCPNTNIHTHTLSQSWRHAKLCTRGPGVWERNLAGVCLRVPLNSQAALNIKFVCCIPPCLWSMQIGRVCVFLKGCTERGGLWESEGANPESFIRVEKTIQSLTPSLTPHHYNSPHATSQDKDVVYFLCVEVTPPAYTHKHFNAEHLFLHTHTPVMRRHPTLPSTGGHTKSFFMDKRKPVTSRKPVNQWTGKSFYVNEYEQTYDGFFYFRCFGILTN